MSYCNACFLTSERNSCTFLTSHFLISSFGGSFKLIMLCLFWKNQNTAWKCQSSYSLITYFVLEVGFEVLQILLCWCFFLLGNDLTKKKNESLEMRPTAVCDGHWSSLQTQLTMYKCVPYQDSSCTLIWNKMFSEKIKKIFYNFSLLILTPLKSTK